MRSSACLIARSRTIPASFAIRPALPDDLPAVQAIYAHHVLHGLGSFEEAPPDLAEIRRRYEEVSGRGLPYLVASAGGVVHGFGYCNVFRPRSAYRFSLEDSVYVRETSQRKGVGGLLLAAMIERGAELGYRQMIAVIGDSANAGSIGLHARLGFNRVGTMRSTGFKFGRWVDTVTMQRPLGAGDGTLPEKGSNPR